MTNILTELPAWYINTAPDGLLSAANVCELLKIKSLSKRFPKPDRYINGFQSNSVKSRLWSKATIDKEIERRRNLPSPEKIKIDVDNGLSDDEIMLKYSISKTRVFQLKKEYQSATEI
jgi:hypothetical protein